MDERSSNPPEDKPAKRRTVKPDANETAWSIVQQATGEIPKAAPPPEKNQAAVTLGRLGGLKGGKARAAKLTPEQRAEIATAAAQARWKKS